MMKSKMLPVLLTLLLLAGCGGETAEEIAQTAGGGGTAEPIAFRMSMGCADPECTDDTHHHDCPAECAELDHWHDCPEGCDDTAHAHYGTSHHSDRHHNS